MRNSVEIYQNEIVHAEIIMTKYACNPASQITPPSPYHGHNLIIFHQRRQMNAGDDAAAGRVRVHVRCFHTVNF